MTTRRTTRAGLQIPNFTYPDVANEDLFERVAEIATTGERAGFDTVFVMDHFFQLPLLGPPHHEMFEAYTLLGALAARTATARLGTLVTGVTYREPAILAKQVTALDVISRGRALLGIGAAWFDVEHEALGVEFPPVAERFEHLEDALRICRAMFTEEGATVSGTHHSVAGAFNVPPPVQDGGPPILIGGAGERKTFRMAAQYADELNVIAGFDELPGKLAALQRHLDDLGRDRSDIAVSTLAFLVPGQTHAEAETALHDFARRLGIDDPAAFYDSEAGKGVLARVIWGDPDEVAKQASDVLAAGLDGLVVNLPANGHDLGIVSLAGDIITSVVGAA